jgi:hypothetical protein
MKILLIHTHYQLYYGEDVVVEQEVEAHTIAWKFYIFKIKALKGALGIYLIIWSNLCGQKSSKKNKEFQPDVVCS